MTVRLRLRALLLARGWTPDLLARAARLPRREVFRLMQDVAPRTVRLAVLGRIALVLEVPIGDLFEQDPPEISAGVRLRPREGCYEDELEAEDPLADLEDAWARDYPDDARKDSDARARWPFLFDG